MASSVVLGGQHRELGRLEKPLATTSAWQTLSPFTPAGGGKPVARQYLRGSKKFWDIREKMARLTGLEPATPGVTGRYSNQLSYNRASFRRYMWWWRG